MGFASVGSAADLPTKAPVYKAPITATNNWTGWYVGLNAGGAWGSFDPSTSTVFSPVGYFDPPNVPAINAAGAQSIKPSAFIGGAQLGYNWQTGNIVAGGEVDFQSFHLSGNASTNAVYPSVAPANFTIASSAHSDWLFTARPRIGIANDGWLAYVTGGLAVTELNGTFSFTDSFAAPLKFAEGVTISNTKIGYVLGGGVEALLSGNWSLKVEYLYVNLGTVSAVGLGTTPFTIGFGSNNNPFTHSLDLKASIARLGINLKLN
jgi:outer membrane immunogenic protein